MCGVTMRDTELLTHAFALCSTLSPPSEVVSEYALSKLVELWNHSGSDGFLYYAFRPPWVRRTAQESFFVLHPEMSVPGGKFVDGARQERIAQGEQEQLRLTAGSGASTARSQHGGSDLARTQAQQPSTIQLAGNPPPAAVASSSHQAKMSAEEREQMANLMASFDAGLVVRKDAPAASSSGSGGTTSTKQH
jgi:hypothetical protein